MNNFILWAILSGLVLLSHSIADAAQEPQDVVTAYFYAMKSGDVVTMKSYLDGKLLKKRKILLEKNTSYPDFLRNLYEKGDIQVGEANDGVVKVMIHFPDGNMQVHQLVVNQNSSGQWKIVDEISKDR